MFYFKRSEESKRKSFWQVIWMRFFACTCWGDISEAQAQRQGGVLRIFVSQSRAKDHRHFFFDDPQTLLCQTENPEKQQRLKTGSCWFQEKYFICCPIVWEKWISGFEPSFPANSLTFSEKQRKQVIFALLHQKTCANPKWCKGQADLRDLI